MKKHLLLAISVIILATACKKDGKDDNCPTTMEGIAGTYKLQSATADGADITAFYFDDCERDNEIVLKADGSYDFVDAGTKCTPPSDASGNWSLSGNIFTIDLLPTSLTLEDFDCTTLRGSANVMGSEVKVRLRKQ